MTRENEEAAGEQGRAGEPAHDDVRRILAAAGSEPESLPPTVAARLDHVLEALTTERAAQPGLSSSTGDRTSSSSTRPARRLPQLLVAAAAVSVLGLGVGNLVGQSGGSEDASAGRATIEDQAGGRSAPETEREPNDVAGSGEDPESARTQPPRLRSRSLRADVQRIARLRPPAGAGATAQDRCALPTLTEGDERVAVRLDGRPATLVLRAPEGGRRVAEVFACRDASAPVATTSVAAR